MSLFQETIALLIFLGMGPLQVLSQANMFCPPNGVPTRCNNNIPSGEWRSNITGVAPFTVMWQPDPTLQEGAAAYVIATRSLQPVENFRVTMPTSDFESLRINQLRPDTLYEAIVCYSNVTRPDVPIAPDFSRDCGHCRTCFRTPPPPPPPTTPPSSTSPSPPPASSPRPPASGSEILQATVELTSDGSIVATCTARGSPRPRIIWMALNQANQREEVFDSFENVEIVENLEPRGLIISNITLLAAAGSLVYSEPSCTARNGVASDMVRFRDFDIISGSEALEAAEILEATLGLTTDGIFATCEAQGVPMPRIIWIALNEANEHEEVLDSFENVEIFVFESGSIISSNITLLTIEGLSAVYSEPSCIARNGISRDRVGFSDFEIISGSQVVISGTTVEQISEGIQATCEARGVPRPRIIWMALNSATDQREEVLGSFENVEISEMFESDNTVVSEITLLMAERMQVYSEPSCSARNGLSSDAVDFADFEMIDNTNTDDSSVTLPVYAIVLLVVLPGIIILSIIVAVGLCGWHRLYRKKPTLRMKVIEENEYVPKIKLNEITDDPTSAILRSTLPEHMIIPPSVMKVLNVIGQGEFGVVYKALMQKEGAMQNTVAVKSLKGIFTTSSDIEQAVQEILKMKQFNHPNVMSLIGVCLSADGEGYSAGPSIVMPFMSKGSLLSFLRKESDNLKVATDDDATKINVVRKQLVQICLQIAKGMEYLASLKFIHRDLAARNCLIDVNGIIKVSDFGLAEDIYLRNYFRQDTSSDGPAVKLPIKWMALESIKLGIFSEKTDVWSYGVTCWEVFAGGEIPYPGVHPREMVGILEVGERLDKTSNAAMCNDMYTLLLSCWDAKPEVRPAFSNMVNILEFYLETTSDYLDLNTVPKIPDRYQLSGEESKIVLDSAEKERLDKNSLTITEEPINRSNDNVYQYDKL